MSQWTHILGVIRIDTHKEKKDIEEFVKEKMNDAPKITGSERDADIFVNVLSGHNTWTNKDCNHCKYGKTVKYIDSNGTFICDGPSNFECPEGNYQTDVVITIVGDLRDRNKQRTKEEWYRFKEYIEKGLNFDTDEISLKISDEWEERDYVEFKSYE